ncbi:hypothetical protein GGR55DRAFT_397138 [Xylaria sp. FL0064]|nr:hypothetical protein GGR55DRAFT_397138 [Xylaria sp. FL0064]
MLVHPPAILLSPPLEYESPTKARGKTVGGDLRLGEVVPSPVNIYPVLTQGQLPLFSPDMRIPCTRLCEFAWGATSEGEHGGTIGGGAPIATAVGAVVNAELSAEFKQTMKNWANFGKVDIEVVQPSQGYIEAVLALPDVEGYIERQRPLFGFPIQWTLFVLMGLMIARADGTVGSRLLSHNNYRGPRQGASQRHITVSEETDNSVCDLCEQYTERCWNDNTNYTSRTSGLGLRGWPGVS